MPKQELQNRMELTLDDSWFKLYCFFEDLNRHRAFIEKVWEDVARQRLSNLVASILTNVILQLVAALGREITATNLQNSDADHGHPSVSKLATMLANLRAIIPDIDRYNPTTTELKRNLLSKAIVSEDFVFLRSFQTINKYFLADDNTQTDKENMPVSPTRAEMPIDYQDELLVSLLSELSLISFEIAPELPSKNT